MAEPAPNSHPQELESRNPATGEILGTVPIDDDAAVNAVVARARAASSTWGALSFSQRREELSRWRRQLASRADELAELIHRETGKPRVDAMGEIMLALSHLDHAPKRAPVVLASERVKSGIQANVKSTVTYHPLGVVGVIGPWNYPLFTPMGSIAYAMAAGNAVVFKPSELSPLVGKFMEETAHQAMAIKDAFLVVTGMGATGAALARAHVDKIAFTGSPATGRKVMIAAAERLTPVLMELGGKDPMIVAADADVNRAAEAAVYGALQNAGQACTSIERCYVATEVYDRFVDKVVELTQDVTVGEDDESKIGAITMPRQVDIIRRHIDDAVEKGAKVLIGGTEGIRGSLIPATVLVDVTDDMTVMRDETFGPVLPIARVDSIDEAVSRANDTAYGLGASVFSKHHGRDIADRIRSGMTAVNAVLQFAAVPSLPFGGVGESGFGRIHGDEGLREFARAKATTEEQFALPMNLMSFSVPNNLYSHLKTVVEQLYGGGIVDKASSKLASILRR